jgi:hypothetical protein
MWNSARLKLPMFLMNLFVYYRYHHHHHPSQLPGAQAGRRARLVQGVQAAGVQGRLEHVCRQDQDVPVVRRAGQRRLLDNACALKEGSRVKARLCQRRWNGDRSYSQESKGPIHESSRFWRRLLRLLPFFFPILLFFLRKLFVILFLL